MILHKRVILSTLFCIAFTIYSSNVLLGQAPCNTTYYDTGGSGANYANNQNYTTTYTAPAGNVLRITFASFNTEAGYDVLSIYNGANTSAPLVNSYSGTSIPPVYTTTGTTLTIKFVSDASVVAAGWRFTLTCIAACSNTTSGGTITDNQSLCGGYDPTNITSSAAASGGSGTLSYQWESSINNSTWADISGATLATYDPPAITQTTYYRRKSKNSGCTPWGATSNTITKTVLTSPSANAGADKSQCENSVFLLVANNPLGGQTGTWSVVSGTAYTTMNLNNDSIYYSVPIGTATIRWSVTNGTCTITDDVVLTNTTGCSTACTNPLNVNGDLENEGAATNFNLTFQSTPAQLIIDDITPLQWVEGYGSTVPNASAFTGAYYIKKTGANGNPHSGTHMIYMAGPVCYGPLNTSVNISCGRTFRISAWVAAFSNSAIQENSSFAIEAFISDWENVNPTLTTSVNLVAQASASWNNLNWERYTFDVTIPSDGYENINIVFSTSDNINGIVIDDACITEVNTGSTSYAGEDILGCSTSFNLAANTPPVGYTGTWSVVSGSATIGSGNSPTSTATLTSGSSATLRWTVSSGASCGTYDDVVIGYSSNALSVNNATLCAGGSATLTANGCSGNLLWSNGSTSSSITVSPASTTSYSVSCTVAPSANAVLNPGLESATNMQYWSNWQNTTVTTTAGEVRTGSKALRLNPAGNWSGCAQDVPVSPGQRVDVSMWAKVSNVGDFSFIRIKFLNASYTDICVPTLLEVNSTTYANYSKTLVAPPFAAFVQLNFESGGTAIMNLDDISLTTSAICGGTATGTVTISNAAITLATPVVSSVINHPLQDVVTVDVNVSWTNPPSGEDILVRLGEKTEYISVSTGATSPQTIRFIVPANGVSRTINALWSGSQTLTSIDLINGFQMMSEGNTTVSGSAHIHGPLAVGSNLVVNGGAEINMDAAGTYTFPGDNSTTGLLVKGGITWSSGIVKVLNQKLMHIQSSSGSSSGDNGTNSATQVYPSSGAYNNAVRIESTFDQTPSPAVFQTVGYDFTSKFTELRNYSSEFNSKTSNVTLVNSSTNGVIANNNVSSATNVKITSLSSIEVNYLNLSSSSLANITEFKFEGSGIPSASKVLIINVPITANFVWNNSNMPGVSSLQSPYILWNFYSASTYNFTINNSNLVIGTIFAPNLNVIKNSTNDIDGQVMGKTIQVGLGEIHYFPFSGDVFTPNGCTTSVTAPIPSPLSNDKINCNILYLCGLDKPADGDAWDHGFINYLTEVSTGTITPILTKPDASGMGTYNPESQSTFVTVNLNNYRLIVISPTTQGYLSTDLKNALANYAGGILNMNYESADDLGMTNGAAFYNFQNNAYINASSQINVYNYDNINPSFGLVQTGGNMNTRGIASLWFGAGNSTTTNNAISFEYQAHSITNVSSTQGKRVYLGFHPNGLYANAQNNGYIPAPTSSYFHPTKHLTLEAKTYLDQALIDASACTLELCTNGIDDDEDGLSDCYDPDCNFLTNGEFDTSTSNWSLFNNAGGNTATYTIDNTSQLTGKNSAKLTITAATGTEWHLQFAQTGETIEAGKKYTLSFRAKASASRNISATVDLGISPFTGYFYQTVALTTTAQTYSYTFTASATVTNNARVLFNLAAGTGTIYLDQISFREACDEICNNGIDDDGDGFIDALDSRCNNCAFVGQNMITNGEFDSGNTGFTSDYIFTPISGMCGNFGIYSVGSRISQVGAPNGCNIPIWAAADRANAGGNFMLIDPSSATGVNDRIWAQTLTVCPNTDYVFSVWTKNMYYAEAGGYSGVDPNFQFKINGTALPDANFIMPRQARIDSTIWIKVQGTWNSGSATTAILNIVNKIPGNYGNDLAIDGLFFGLCGKTVAITAATTSFCAGSSTTLSATSQTTSSGWLFYEWVKDGVVVSSGTTATSYVATAAGTYKLRTYYTTPNNTGCPTESNSITITTIAKPTIGSPSPLTLCVGATASITPSTLGTWTSSNTAVATITNAGLITAVAAGTATFTYTLTSNGCQSDASTSVTVNAKPTVSITGSSTICVGTTTNLSPSTGGVWTSSNTAIATVSNAGVVTGVSTGTATFTFTHSTTNCASLPTNTVTVNAKPTVSITGATTICAGSTTTLSPTTGGTWVSNNTAVATVTNGGVVTGVSGGTATFTFTNSTTLCPSDATSAVTVNARPTINITGSNTSLCIGGTTTVSPTTLGTWVSSNTAVATISNAGLITAIAAGSATFTYTLTSNGCTSVATAPFTVNVKPSVSITGTSTICVGSTTTLSPTTGGTWTSNNTAVATVTNGGVVTGVSGGTATFTFTSSTTLCPSDATNTVTVNARPTTNITGSNTSLCIGGTTTVSPTTLGTWVSSNTAVATITNAGLITAVAAGTATFTYTLTSNGCTSLATSPFTVNAKPSVSITGASTICVGSNTTLSPSTGGTWSSSNTAVATVTSGGVVTGVSGGTATFTFTNSTTLCPSDATNTVTVNARPTTNITGSNTSLCIGGTTTVGPTTLGTWVSSNTAVATITNAGLITAVAAGTATFTYTLTSNGCSSLATSPFTVNAKPSVSITGASTICVGSTTTLSPSTGGTWTSSNTAVATVTSGGVVTGVSGGTATFTFTNSTTLCPSDATNTVTVNARPTTNITGSNTSLCIGGTTTVSPTTLGTWVSSNTAVATITNAGLITAVAAGTATFTYTLTSNGCSSLATSPFTVNAKPSVSITGASTICVGSTTTLNPTTGGTWTSSNTAVATVTSGGVVTGVSGGTATFTFTSSTTLCPSDATSTVTVNARPTTNITGSNTSLCIGGTTTVSPTTLGTWVSSNTAVATITNAGLITAVAAGTATFTYTLTSNGCSSLATSPFTVNAKPVVSITGASTICEGSTTTLSPSIGGTWTSSNTAVATVTSGGVVTGVSGGTATFTFTSSTTLCPSDATSTVTVNARPTTNITGSNTSLCIGGTTTVSPTTLGTWVSSNTSVATITNAGLITAVAAGTSTFTYTLTSTGCSSLAISPFTVNAKPTVSITGASTICEGSTTTLSPISGGTWVSSNTAVATVTSGGVVTGVSGGTVTFTFTSSTTLCPSDATNTVTVNARPTTNITGSNTSLCIGGTTTVSPTTLGTWVSSNTSVATITNAGLVTAVAAGTATFTYTLTSNGCSSLATSPFTVNVKPSVSITGASTICEGSTTTLSPTTGGTWVSNNTAIATVTSGGVVTGVSGGTATFTFTSSTTLCPSDATSTVTVNARPTTNITGSNTSLCIGGTTTASPTTLGTWVSSNTAVATITNAGLVTAVAAGTATFTYTLSSTGCSSLATSPFTVNVKPSVSITGASTICEGSTTTLSPTTGGTWVSNNTAVATVTNGGVVTGVSGGTATFTFTSSTTLCPSDATSTVTVNARPTTNITGSNTSLCIGGTTTASPTNLGTWVSSNTSVATITNAGLITAVAAGTATFTYTLTSNGCSSLATSPFTVNAKPSVSITGASTICEGSTTTLSPTTGGTWVSNNTAVATVTNGGVVTGVNGGTATFTFTNSTTLCPSDATSTVTVNARPTTNITGSNTSLCIGNTTTVSPTTLGTWVSSNTAVATITNSGLITAVAAGTVTFTYTLTSTGCSSLATSPFTVNVKPSVSITGASTICVGSTTTLSPSTGGTWSSNNTAIATVTNGGVVTGVSGGTTTFTFTQTSTGCPSDATNTVTVNARPTTNITGSNTSLCIGGTTTVSPTTLGTWVSSNTAVATITNAGLITAVAAGTATFTYTLTSTGCSSLATAPFTVNAKPTVSITGASTICAGSTTTLSPTTGGTWVSSNNAIATVTNAGVVTGVSGGSVTFTFTSSTTLCPSNPTNTVNVNFRPTTNISGSNTSLCIGGTTTVSPTTLGAWVSSNTAVATITNAGLITAVSAGTATFTYTLTSTGCSSIATSPFTVNAKPSVNITGASTICVGSTTSLSPTTGGIWVSSNTAVATVTNAGVVTGVNGGTATFTFTNSTTLCPSDATNTVTVNARPTTNITGSNTSLCIGGTTTVSPTTLGTWVSSNTSVATITNAGLITAVAAGTATFTYTLTSTGCSSIATSPFTVNAKPIVSITGASTICVGSTTTLSPTSGGTWASSNTGVATVTNAGVVTGVSGGTVTFTFTNSTTLCPSNATNTVTVNARPTTNITGSNTSLCIGNTTTVSPTTLGTWVSSNTSVATITNAGLITAVAAGTATFTYTLTSTGCNSLATSPFTVNAKPTVSITGANTICEGSTTTLNPTIGGTWVSSNTAVATVTNAGVVTGVSGGTVTFTFTNSTTLCPSDATNTITVNGLTPISNNGPSKICIGNTALLSPSSGGTWTSSNNSVATVNSSGVVFGIAGGSTTLTFVNTAGCLSNTSITIDVGQPFTTSIDYNGSVCLTNNKTLEATNNGGTAPFVYSWTGPSSFTANTKIINITTDGNYYLTISDSYGCISSTSGFVYGEFIPLVVSLQTQVCEGQSITLDASSASNTNYLWNDSAGNATTASVVVTPLLPSSTYIVTVTNNLGCTASATAIISVLPKPTVTISGSATICQGTSTTLTPTTGGTWTSNDNSIATVTSSGIVSGISAGVATFTFTNSTTNCVSDPTLPITINPKPIISLTGPPAICIGNTTSFTPTSGGTWTSNNPSIATIDNSGLVTGVSEGTATFYFTNVYTCSSLNSIDLVVNKKEDAIISGVNALCHGSGTQLYSTRGGGTWTTSNSSIVSITNAGFITAVNPGSATITYTHYSGACLNEATYSILVNANPLVDIQGADVLCQGDTTRLSPITGGTWTSADNSVATVTNSGLVTAINAGSTIFTFTQSSTGCISQPTQPVLINAKPNINITGSANLCIGATTTLTPNTGGTWTSSNNSIATITNDGTVIALAGGTATFTYTHTNTGCFNASSTVTVASPIVGSIDFNGSICLTNSSILSANMSGGITPYAYSWIGPKGSAGNTRDISIDTNGNYFVTITDAFGCSVSRSGFVYEKFEPIFIGLQSQVCEGQNVNLSVNGNNVASYLWGSNAGNSTSSSVTVMPSLPSTIYNVTVTNSIGCSVTLVANINVNPKPVVSINGASSICIGNTSTLLPSSGGIWVSNNPSIASVNNSGIATAISSGTATFTFTNLTTGCVSNQSLPLTVNPKPVVSISGSNNICIGASTTLSPSSLGTWTSSNNAIATVNNSGVVTAVSDGIASFNYTSNATGCTSDATLPVTINPKPTVFINGPNSICVGATTTLSPNYGGTWSSNNTSIATITNTGLVTGVSGGNVTFVYTESNGCLSDPTSPVTIKPKPVISITGSNSICIGTTTTMSPSNGGIWISSNSGIAAITNTGIVTGISAGTAKFTFTSGATGCSSNESAPVEVKPNPVVSLNGPSVLCIGATTSFSPSTGGTWISNNSTVASINNSGIVTALSQGLSTFRFTNATGCQSSNTANITVNPRPSTILQGDSEICVGGNTQFYPQSGGTWSSNNPSVAVISNNGIVLGISQGTTTFRFTDNSTSCISNNTAPIDVLDPLNIGFTGPTNICVGSTSSLYPSFGGTWISSNSNIASVSSNGEITAISPGIVSFTFTNSISGCQAVTTTFLTVNPKPSISVIGASALCIGGTTSMLPSSGGTWESSNTSIATINNSGIITAVNSGNVTFKFTDAITGCVSSNSPNIAVYNKPTVSVVGSSSICIGGTTTLYPATGGTWISNNTAILNTTNSGIVVGLSAGSSTLKFIEAATGCESDNTSAITVNPKPTITLSGSNTICVGSTSAFLPSTGGNWTSNNASVATISTNGIVTGIAQGVASFLFTSTVGCPSDATEFITVNGKPSVSISGPSLICIGTTTSLSPSSGGTWVSNNPSIASITNSGVVTGIATGSTTFTFTNSTTGCSSLASTPVTVNTTPIATINGPSSICISGTTQVLPSSGGVWSSSNTSIATINNSGQIVGIDAGTATFTYTNTQTGCSSDGSISVTVNARPPITLAGPASICINTSTTFTSSAPGTWQAKNPTIASISSSGIVTGITNGTAKFTFTNTATGCVSSLSATITVNPKPPVFLIGPAEICVGSTTTLSPIVGGTWTSNNPSIATVSNDGIVTGVAPGTASFVYTESLSGCTSNNTSNVSVVNPTPISITSTSTLCIDQKSYVSPSAGGVWTSTNSAIATINNNGEIRAKAPGKVSFSFTNSNTGCVSTLPADTFTVISCIDPDFNVTVINTLLHGNVKTNDDAPIINGNSIVEYSVQPNLISKPASSIANLQMNNDGSYTFTANKAGQYEYNVGLCFGTAGCTFSNLMLTVIDDKDTRQKMVANTDIVSTYKGSMKELNTMYNDKCINAVTCNLVSQQMNILNQPINGSMQGLNDGWSAYTPSALFVGMDTIDYRICAWENSTNCKHAYQFVTVKHHSATNSTVGADDFFSAYQDTMVIGNLLSNDSDPEQDLLSIVPQGSPSNPIAIAQGVYHIEADGSFLFKPNPSFYGPLDIVYTVCDNNADQSCTKATAHILIVKDMTLKLRAYLEGSLTQSEEFTSAGKPLMRDELRNNFFDGKNYIPKFNPYRIPTNDVDVTQRFGSLIYGQEDRFDEILDSAAVFSVTGENAIVDWVFVEIREKSNYNTKLSCRAALIQRDGDIVDIDGVSDVKFPRLNADSFYVVVRHRNHLGVMSLLVSQTDFVDFTKVSTPVFDFGTTLQNGIDYTGLATNNFVIPNYRALWAGDFDADGKLKFTNPGDDQNILFFDVFSSEGNTTGNANYNFTIGYYQGDYNMNGKSKYDNPDDDKNLLFSQILLYPLNEQFLSNFNFFVEQVPHE